MRATGLVAAWILVGTAMACQGRGLERVRSVTYPPDFHYITGQEIRSTMGQLAVEMLALEQQLEAAKAPDPQASGDVIETLTRMRALAMQLKKRPNSNHPRIDAHAPRLREDIDRALVGARRTPVPDYYYAGRALGGCGYCHASPRP